MTCIHPSRPALRSPPFSHFPQCPQAGLASLHSYLYYIVLVSWQNNLLIHWCINSLRFQISKHEFKSKIDLQEITINFMDLLQPQSRLSSWGMQRLQQKNMHLGMYESTCPLTEAAVKWIILLINLPNLMLMHLTKESKTVWTSAGKAVCCM